MFTELPKSQTVEDIETLLPHNVDPATLRTDSELSTPRLPDGLRSPLYDPETGEVIGVNNNVLVKESNEAALEKPSGIAYAVPVRYVKELLRDAGVAQ